MLWNPSAQDANGTEERVRIRKVSLFQGSKLFPEKEKVSLLERCPHFWGFLTEGFHSL